MAINYKKKKKSITIWDWKVNLLVILAIVSVIIAFFAPIIFTQIHSGIEFNTETSQIGNTFGGLATPFIAIAGICITFLAFYMQLRANQIQIKNFQKEISLQKRQNNLNQFEGKFYEMIRLHKENVNEIHLLVPEKKGDGIVVNKEVNGREAFQYFENELRIAYYYLVEKGIYRGEEFNKAYQAFFSGILDKPAFEELNVLVENHESRFVTPLPGRKSTKFLNNNYVIAKYKILQGHENKLGHYYRHLFHTVKFVAEQNDKFLSYRKKREYLALLRAQLSNYEQLMIFYNYLGLATEWEDDKNRFLSDYRMIHNLKRYLIMELECDNGEGELLRNFDSLKEKEMTAKKYKDPDPIFDTIYI